MIQGAETLTTFDRVLVPLDGTDFSMRALASVARLVRHSAGEVTLLRVLPAEQGAGPEAQARDELAAVASRLLEEGVRTAVEVVRGDPADRILSVAVETRADLIAMATRGRTGVDLAIHGSVTQRVLRNTRTPLLVLNSVSGSAWSVRNASRVVDEVAWKQILVPLDGSRESARVLPVVRAIARAHGSRVVLLHVEEPGCSGPLALLARWQRVLEDVPTTLQVAKGDPASAIIEVAASGLTDLVALTTHGRTGLGRWAFGSVAEGVIRHVSAPILVVRSPDKAG